MLTSLALQDSHNSDSEESYVKRDRITACLDYSDGPNNRMRYAITSLSSTRSRSLTHAINASVNEDSSLDLSATLGQGRTEPLHPPAVAPRILLSCLLVTNFHASSIVYQAYLSFCRREGSYTGPFIQQRACVYFIL